jgi:hypothetical protein
MFFFQTLNSITIELNGEFDFNKLDQFIIQLLWNEQNTTQEIVRMKVYRNQLIRFFFIIFILISFRVFFVYIMNQLINFFKLLVKCMNLFLQRKIIMIIDEIVLYLLDQILIKIF